LLSATLTPALATDRWEATLISPVTDDNSTTQNILRHGVPQIGHDVDGGGDEDWMVVRTKNGHSYEARVSSAGLHWENGCFHLDCPRFDRVNANGAVLTPGVVSSDDTGGLLADFGDGPSVIATGLSARWISTTDAKEFVRMLALRPLPWGALLNGLTYDVEFYDTTYFLPRWNNSATQFTVVIIQNTTNATVTGNMLFYGATGTQLHSEPFSIPEHGVRVFSSSSVTALAGQAGSANIVHTGGYGALAGKAVALEPGSGFSFDTPLMPLPR
jgi:hypothetical protein